MGLGVSLILLLDVTWMFLKSLQRDVHIEVGLSARITEIKRLSSIHPFEFKPQLVELTKG